MATDRKSMVPGGRLTGHLYSRKQRMNKSYDQGIKPEDPVVPSTHFLSSSAEPLKDSTTFQTSATHWEPRVQTQGSKVDIQTTTVGETYEKFK